VTKIIPLAFVNFVTLKAGANQKLLFSKLTSAKQSYWFVVKKLELSSSFMCDQIQNIFCYEFSHTLKHHISLTQMINEPASDAGLYVSQN
jgi:hypothetical protein